jgi:hypothetical protein
MLPVPNACEDDGKVIFHAFKKKFRPPRRCIFVAPRGPTTELRDMLLNHDKLKAEIISTWDKRVANKVVVGKTHILAGELPTTFTRTTLVRLAIPLSTKSSSAHGLLGVAIWGTSTAAAPRPNSQFNRTEGIALCGEAA